MSSRMGCSFIGHNLSEFLHSEENFITNIQAATTAVKAKKEQGAPAVSEYTTRAYLRFTYRACMDRAGMGRTDGKLQDLTKKALKDAEKAIKGSTDKKQVLLVYLERGLYYRAVDCDEEAKQDLRIVLDNMEGAPALTVKKINDKLEFINVILGIEKQEPVTMPLSVVPATTRAVGTGVFQLTATGHDVNMAELALTTQVQQGANALHERFGGDKDAFTRAGMLLLTRDSDDPSEKKHRAKVLVQEAFHAIEAGNKQKAESCLNEALENINFACSEAPEAENYFIRSLIYYNLANVGAFQQDIDLAISMDPTNKRYTDFKNASQ